MASKLIDSQTSFFNTLLADIAAFQNSDKSSTTVSKIKIMMKDLEDCYQSSKSVHSQIMLCKTSDLVTSYINAKTYENIRESYFTYWSILDEFLPQNTEESVLNQTVNPAPFKVGFKLPKIDIPKFQGNYREWRKFYNLFRTLVHENVSLQGVQKLSYLQSFLEGEAADLIKHIELDGNNYSIAWKLVKERYDHNRILVYSELKTLFNQPSYKVENSNNIKGLLDTTRECLISLKNLGAPTEHWDFIINYLLEEKLPKITKQCWEEQVGKKTTIPTYIEMRDFLSQRFRMLEMIELADDKSTATKSFHIQNNKVDQGPVNSKNNKNVNLSQKSYKCIYCKNNHSIYKCTKFIKISSLERFNFSKSQNLCLNCLSNSHKTSSCFVHLSCRVCHKRHHTLLHLYPTNAENNSSANALNSAAPSFNPQPSTSQNFHINATHESNSLMNTAIVNIINKNNNKMVQVRALVDPCSDDSYVTSEVVNLLGLNTYTEKSNISVLGAENSLQCNTRTKFEIYSNTSDFNLLISAAIIGNISSRIPNTDVTCSWNHLNDLLLADPTYNKSGKVDMLLGVAVYAEIILSGLRKGGKNMPIAQNTKLGWLISGNTHCKNIKNTFLTFSNIEEKLETILPQFWQIEEVENKIMPSPDDALCEEIFNNNILQYEDGHYGVSLPFRNNIKPILGPSKDIAMRRFLNLEKRLRQLPDLRENYKKAIDDFIESGHMVPSSTHSNNLEYFLPHHAVVKESSSTTKVRPVFDASCKTLDGTSLNDHLLPGPKLQNDIFDVIFRWRKYRFSFTADISKMYRQIWVHPEYHAYQKVLWRDSETLPIQEYFLRTVTFGMTSAPYLAIRVLHFLAEKAKTENRFTHAIDACFSEFYVDDLLSGAHSIVEAKMKQKEISELLMTGSLELRKWSSSHKEILDDIPEEMREKGSSKTFDDTEFIKTLGIFWRPDKDVFSFSINDFNYESQELTKRKILSIIAKLYDPLGWLSPCIFFAKCIMQKLWIGKLGWDEIPEISVLREFQSFLSALPALQKIEIPRWTHILDDSSELKLYGFCDASEKGYGAVVYLQNEETRSLVLLASKTKVAPLKCISLARLELCGAVLLSDLLKKCRRLLDRPCDMMAFCDSKITLAWIQSEPSRWKTFIANRTTRILENTKACSWHYINTKYNPADIASRGILASLLVDHSLWWNGPPLSLLEQNQVDFENEIDSVRNELKTKTQCFFVKQVDNEYIKQFSTFQTLCKKLNLYAKFFVICMGKLVLKNSRNKSEYSEKIKRLSDPEAIALRLVQSEHFHNEIESLKSVKNLDKNSKILSLNPFLDQNGLLRVGGRLENATCSYDQKHPIILPTVHQVTVNLIRWSHFQTLHGGTSLTHSFLRNRFHIIRGKNQVKKVIRHCITCIRYSKVRHNQLMGSLPKTRVNEFRPFLNSGVDFAGPISLKTWKGKCNRIIKSYISVFVCLSTKAIHLELVSDLSSESFLAAFRRFTSRRGQCKSLYSDCGTNFKGADKLLENELKMAQKTWKSELCDFFEKGKTDWHFIPPATPHFGGLWEAGVKSVKTHLIKIIGGTTLVFEELYTLLTQIEAVLNSRPLCPVSDNPSDFAFLSPAHFLIGEPLIAPPEPPKDIKNITLIKRWEHIQKMKDQFWHQWRTEYLHRLQKRPKWASSSRNFQINDLVLLTDERFPPTQWPIARIVSVYPGKDEMVRVVDVKTANGKSFRRPITKLRLLPSLEIQS